VVSETIRNRCPLRVNRVDLAFDQPLPVYPSKRTSSDRPGMSERCQKETCTAANCIATVSPRSTGTRSPPEMTKDLCGFSVSEPLQTRPCGEYLSEIIELHRCSHQPKTPLRPAYKEPAAVATIPASGPTVTSRSWMTRARRRSCSSPTCWPSMRAIE
jgi:hypothetical protein